jgi:hypothetical protein
MLRRLLLVTLICATLAGPSFGADEAMAGCGDGGITGACVMPCTCIVGNVPILQASVPAFAPPMHQVVRIADTGSPPDPAPPKR